MAIEIDGHGYHAKLERDQFTEQLKRQNELSMAGWRIIRFSYDQVVGNPADCRRVVEATLAESPTDNISMKLEFPEIYTEIVCRDITNAERIELKKQGAIFSDIRKMWYMPSASYEEVAKAFPSRKLNRWKKCPNCDGTAYHRTGPYGDFWACQGCEKTFN